MKLIYIVILTITLHQVIRVDSGFSNFIDVDDDTFYTKLHDFEIVLVMFSHPSCIECQNVSKEFSVAGELLNMTQPNIAVAIVDCNDSGQDTCEALHIESFPDLKIYNYGSFQKDYLGPRNADDIVRIMRHYTGAIPTELETVEEVEDFVDQYDIHFIGFFENKFSTQRRAFLHTANVNHRNYLFGHVSKVEIMNKYLFYDDIVAFRPKYMHSEYENNSDVYKGELTPEAIISWVEIHGNGLVGVRNPVNQHEFTLPMVIVYFVDDYMKNVEDLQHWRSFILPVAKTFKKDYTFVISSRSYYEYEVSRDFGKNATQRLSTERPIVTCKDKNGNKFIMMKDEYTTANIHDFIMAIKTGNMVPFIKSQPIPIINNGTIKIAVATNFDEIVWNNGRDTLVNFYAPWCGYCVQFATVFAELGQKLADEPIELVQYDAINNDVPKPFQVTAFPTLYWVPIIGRDKPIKYVDSRLPDKLLAFVANQATSELGRFSRQGLPKKTEL